MMELGLGRLQTLYHCRVCNRVSVYRAQLSRTPTRLILQSAIQDLKNVNRVTFNPRNYNTLSGRLIEKFRVNPSKVFQRGTAFSSGLRHLTLQHLFKSPVSTKITLASGGLLCGGLLLCGNKLHQTAHCKDENETDCVEQTLNSDSSQLSLAETPINELSLLQQLKLVVRFVYLSFLFSPAAILYGASYLTGNDDLESLAWKYFYFAIQMAGPAFIKLGQWASTRRDIFSEEFCKALSKLHTRCNPHSWPATDRIMRENFGDNWKDNIVIVDHDAIGSGCVAQVYQGYLKTHDSKSDDSSTLDKLVESDIELKEGTLREEHGYVPIAIKVLHPGMVEAMDGDIRLMKYVASLVDRLYPDVHWIALRECVDEFSFVMQQQVGGVRNK